MRPRRSLFALDYIVETAEMYQSVRGSNRNAELVRWSNDVLMEYFEIVGESPIVSKAKRLFRTCDLPFSRNGHPKKPYTRDLQRPDGITIDQLEQLAVLRRSCRWFLQKSVPRDIIDRALAVAGYAPSACNRQPFEFRFFDDPELVRKVAAIPGGTSGFHHNFPCVAVIVGQMSAFPFDRDRHVPYIDSSLAAMGFQFALEVQGVSSCCINWPDVPSMENQMSAVLNLQADQRVVMMMAIGYPDPTGMVAYSQKKSLAELRSYNRTS